MAPNVVDFVDLSRFQYPSLGYWISNGKSEKVKVRGKNHVLWHNLPQHRSGTRKRYLRKSPSSRKRRMEYILMSNLKWRNKRSESSSHLSKTKKGHKSTGLQPHDHSQIIGDDLSTQEPSSRVCVDMSVLREGVEKKQRLGIEGGGLWHIIGAYAPTNCSGIEDKLQFYRQITETLARVDPKALLIVGGDFNARLGPYNPLVTKKERVIARHGIQHQPLIQNGNLLHQ